MDQNKIIWKIIETYFKDNPDFAVKHHLNSYNDFIKKDIPQILRERNPIKIIKEMNNELKDYKYKMELYIGGKEGKKIYYGKPIIYDNKNQHYMFPNEARLRNMNYGVTIHYDIDVDFTIVIENEEGEDEEGNKIEKFTTVNETITIEKIYLGKFPIMLRSDLCILKELTPEVRFNMGECRSDNGGYFIIDGKEKVIVSQEKFADNMLYIKKNKEDNKYSYAAEIRSVSDDASKPIRTLSVRIEAESGLYKNQNIVVNVPNVKKPIPLFILMRALGVISDYEIIETCLLDMKKNEIFVDLFRPSVHDAGTIFTQEAALKYIATLTKGKTKSHVMEILMIYFLPHIGELNFREKSLYLGYIVSRLLRVFIGLEKPTDRDSYKFKRIEISGMLLYQLFREYYILEQRDITMRLDKEYTFKGSDVKYKNLHFKNLLTDNIKHVFKNKIVEEGFRKAFKGNWGSEAHTKRAGVVQDLNRLSFFGSLCHMRKINLPMDKSAKIIEPRLLHGTQWGIICPIHTPDGGNCGLHKHLSISNTITSGCESRPYIKYLRNMGMVLLSESKNLYLSKVTKLFLNGNWVGTTDNPENLLKIMRLHRRNNIIDTFTSIHWNIQLNEICISTDGGRPCHPLSILKEGEPLYMNQEIKSLIDGDHLTWDKLILGLRRDPGSLEDCSIKVNIDNIDKDIEKLEKTAACLEYLDTYECEGILLKSKSNVNPRSTHCEIHPSFILSIMANQIIFPQNNPFPRNAFSCGQGKQGVSMYHTNFNNRIDKTSYVLNYGQIPIVKSRYLDFVSKEKHPYGENAIVAIACYSGFNVEDAVIINRAALERGLFRTTYYNMYDAHEEKQNIGNAKINTKFMSIQNNNVIGKKRGCDYSHLDEETGLIRENTRVTEKVIVIGKATNSLLDPDLYVDMSKATKKGQIGYVDKSFITNNVEGERLAKVRIREERIPEMGDKFCSRAGQKGTIGMVLDECDMPFTKEGIRPDIIVNPHAMPSRMTIGHLVEALMGKACVLKGGYGDCTAFLSEGPKHEVFGNILTQEGFHSSGNEYLYNGMTGEQMETEIYFGPTYYLRLKHMPKDKINYRAKGPRSTLTRQTVGGRANDGGLRIGEMDRDCLVAHGLSHFIQESMMVRGDEFEIAICNKSGCIAIYNESKNIFLSPHADGPLKFVGDMETSVNIVPISKFGRDFSIVKVPYAFKLLMHELKTMNIQMRIITEDNVDQLMTLVEDENIREKTDFNNFEQLSQHIKDLINEDRRTEDVIETVTSEEKVEMPTWETGFTSYEDSPVTDKIYRTDDFEKGQTVYVKKDTIVGKKWTIVGFDEDDGDIFLVEEGVEGGELISKSAAELTPEPPIKSVEKTGFEPLLDNPFLEQEEERDPYGLKTPTKIPPVIDLTLENVKVGDIVFYREEKDKNPEWREKWKVGYVFDDHEGAVGIDEQIHDLMWDEYTEPRVRKELISNLMKEKYEPTSPDYDPNTPTSPGFRPQSPDIPFNKMPSPPQPASPNNPLNSPSFKDINQLQSQDSEENMDYDRGEGPQVRTNLVRIYKKDGKHTDEKGKKYDLESKKEMGKGNLEILGNFDDDENEEDSEENKKASEEVKKAVIKL